MNVFTKKGESGIRPSYEVPEVKSGDEIQTANQKFTLLPENEYSKENQSRVTLCNGSEQILERAGKPLHLKIIIQELETFGRFTDARILNGTIRKDHKNRFVNLGQNVWDLRRRQQPTSEQE